MAESGTGRSVSTRTSSARARAAGRARGIRRIS
jgi:hypothetical protein